MLFVKYYNGLKQTCPPLTSWLRSPWFSGPRKKFRVQEFAVFMPTCPQGREKTRTCFPKQMCHVSGNSALQADQGMGLIKAASLRYFKRCGRSRGRVLCRDLSYYYRHSASATGNHRVFTVTLWENYCQQWPIEVIGRAGVKC